MLVEPVPACHCPLERIEPSKKSFDFPTATITPQGATILRCFTLSIAPMWCDHLNPLGSKGVIERITVIGTIPNNSSGLSHCDNFIEGSLDKGDFMRTSRIRVQGEWKTRSVCAITMSFVPFPRLVFPTFAPLFLPPRTCRQ